MACQAVAEFLETMSPEDELFHLPFDSHLRPMTGFTNNAQVILDQVGRTRAASGKNYLWARRHP